MENSFMNAGAFFLLGAFLLIIFSFQSQSAQMTGENILDARNHSIVETMRLLLRHEVAMIGQGVDSGASILNATDSNISYKADIDNDGTVDTVRFYLEKFDQSPFTNPNIKMFVKEVNGSEVEFGYRGISELKFLYFDENGQTTSTKTDIKFVGFQMALESEEKVNEEYQKILIEDRVLPKNLWM